MPPASERTIVITGLGVISPVGTTVPELWKSLLDGVSGFRALSAVESDGLGAHFHAPVDVDVEAVLGAATTRRMHRVQQLAALAAREAWADAGAPDVDPTRLAVAIGSGVGGVTTFLDQDERLRTRGPRAVSAHTLPMALPNGAAVTVALRLGARAGAFSPVSACASGAEAIHLGGDLIRAGRADVVVCGGAEGSVGRGTLAAFAAMRALSTQPQKHLAGRPFDTDRDGIVLGEGAGVLVLESLEHARRRGRTGYAELAGSAVTSDAYHCVAPDPTGSGAAAAMLLALRDSNATPAEITQVNAHGTGTIQGDAAEARALSTVLGSRAASVPVSATKSMTGHLLGATGAIEAIIVTLGLVEGQVPGVPTLVERDPAIHLDVVTPGPRAVSPGLALSNSFGFGGHNVCLALRPLGA